MKITHGLALSLLPLATLAAAPAPAPTQALTNTLHGDYVEARTASVFAGACHYNGEVVTTGRDAILAWNVTSGTWNGVNLAGVRAIAALTSDANLGDTTAVRRTELRIDATATTAQAAAFADWVRTQHAATLGTVVAVERGPVQFNHQGKLYTVAADHFGGLSVQSMPNDECCHQPNLVWYTPLQKLEHRKVGYTTAAAYTAGTLADTWQRADENSAFYGTFND